MCPISYRWSTFRGLIISYALIAIGAKNSTLSAFPCPASSITRLYRRSALSCGVSCEISGPRTAAPGGDPGIPEPSSAVREAELPDPALLPYAPPAKYATSAIIAIPAIIHGSGDGLSRRPSAAASLSLPPTGRPQPWQNLAPASSRPPHPAHAADSSDAPQLAQKRPDPGVEHTLQTASGFSCSFIAYNLHKFAAAIQAGEGRSIDRVANTIVSG